MKKTISWVSAAVLGLSLLIPQQNLKAWGPIGVEPDNTDLTGGGTSTITFTLSPDAGFNGVDIRVEYPEAKLSVVEMTTNDIYENAYINDLKNEPGKAGMVFLYKNYFNEGGDVLKITFSAKSGAMGAALVTVSGSCTRADTTSEEFGQVVTLSLPSSGGTVDTSTPKPVADVTSAPTAAPASSSGGSSGGGGGSGRPAATAAPSVPKVEETAAPDVATAAPTKAPVPTMGSFTDINGHWAEKSINMLADLGYINGFDDNTFRPEEKVTRAQFVKMIADEKGIAPSGGEQIFKDVPADAWYAPYANAAYAAGIVNGDDDGNFNPSSEITRQEMAVMLMRAYSIAPDGANELSFADASSIADWAAEAVAALSSNGIINGFDDNTFRPIGSATRAQAATVLARFISE